ncbi:hypothetical protein ACFW35_02465 [Fictibacillus sp. NPDC058756]|uniref:hypothetical protein n=1 Tax=Fictibacillus sp. NPDC058756 TaxID=3346625 RepID=UPI003683A232
MQKVIDTTNATNVSDADKAAAVDAVNKATNQVSLLKALQNPLFKRVNSDWIADYDNNVDFAVGVTNEYSTVEDIQSDLNDINETKIDAAILDASDELDATKVSTAKNLVNLYIAEDVAPDTTKAGLLKSLNVHEAVINVTVANTNAKLQSALNKLVSEVNDKAVIDSATVNPNELSRYRTAIGAAALAFKDSAADIQSIITTGNGAAETAVVGEIEAITSSTVNGQTVYSVTTAQLKDLLTKLSDRSKFVGSTPAFSISNVNDALLQDYLVALTPASLADAAAVTTTVIGVNKPKDALDAIKLLTSSNTADEVLAALKAKTLNLSNVVDANKAEYLVDVAALVTEATYAGSPATDAQLATAVNDVKALVSAINNKVILNGATSAATARGALTDFAVATNDADFINLSSSAKNDLAGLVLADIAANGTYDDVAAVTTAIAAQIVVMEGLVDDVNVATDIATMSAALDALDYAAFENLTAARKLDVAEQFLTAFPKNATTGAKIPYTSITGIKTDVSKAITTLGY